MLSLFATQQLLIYPPHLRAAATLPWENYLRCRNHSKMKKGGVFLDDSVQQESMWDQCGAAVGARCSKLLHLLLFIYCASQTQSLWCLFVLFPSMDKPVYFISGHSFSLYFRSFLSSNFSIFIFKEEIFQAWWTNSKQLAPFCVRELLKLVHFGGQCLCGMMITMVCLPGEWFPVSVTACVAYWLQTW